MKAASMTDYAELIQLTKDIAFFLNAGETTPAWTFKPMDEPYPTQYITGPNEAELAIRIETYGARKGRIEVHGNFHIGRDRQFVDVREWNGSERSGASCPRLVRTSEAARYLALSQWSLRRLVQTGALPIVSSCDVCNWRFDVRDLDAWVERNKRTDEEAI